MYSKTVMDHFNHPRNAGVIEDADGIVCVRGDGDLGSRPSRIARSWRQGRSWLTRASARCPALDRQARRLARVD